MSDLAAPLERLIRALCRLPGIGRKSATRLAFHLVDAAESEAEELGRALQELRQGIRRCRECFNVGEQELCPLCSDPRRERTVVCVVETPSDVVALERTHAHRGLYHVLGGVLSPLKDVGPDDLRARELVERIRTGQFREVILATNPDVEGEATAVYLARLLQPLGVPLTRLAQGLPAGGDLEFADDVTLRRAFEGRREY